MDFAPIDSERTTSFWTLSVGTISEVQLFMYDNLGTIINDLLIPGGHGYYDILLSFALISFLILAALVRRQKSERVLPEGEWLERKENEGNSTS